MTPPPFLRKAFCLVCGLEESEVDKLHYFPSVEARSQIWQEKMGMKFVGDTLRHSRICNNHFTADQYLNRINWRLRRDAVPTLLPAKRTPSNEEPILQRAPDTSFQTGSQLTGSFVEQPSTSRTNLHLEVDKVGIEVQPSTSIVQSPKKRKTVFRHIANIEKTPRKVKLMSLVKSKEAQIRTLKRLCRSRKNDIKALTDLGDSHVVRNLFAGMPKTTADFLISQLKCAKRDPRGRRWTLEEKVMALALFKRSPTGYNFLRKLVALPSKRTLLSLLSKVPFEAGINEHIFHHINECISTEKDRYVVLLFDEMDLKENLSYDKQSGRIMGYEDCGPDISLNPNRANKALVFMVCGLGEKKWKQPVAYFLSHGGCSGAVMKKCVSSVLLACQDLAKLEVVTTICDMGTTNVKAVADLGATTEQPFFLVNGKKNFVMFDPPHLLKRTASLFRQYNVSIEVEIAGKMNMMEARFDDIIKAYKKDSSSPLVFRSLYKIRQEHIAPRIKYAMKVSIAAQIMSHSVAAYLYILAGQNELEQRAIATASFVQQVNDLFDSVNGSCLRQAVDGGNRLRCRATAESGHLAFWEQAIKQIRGWQFQRRTKAGLLKPMPPSQKGWITTINSIRAIWQHLQSRGFTSLRTRGFNQDPLENLFAAIRAGCGKSDNPTPVQFMGSLKTQIVNGLSSPSIGGNCEEDEASLLSNLHKFLQTSDGESTKPPLEADIHPLESCTSISASSISEKIIDAVMTGELSTLSVAYVGGYIAKYAFMGSNACSQCEDALFGSAEEPHNAFIQNKEFSASSTHLCYPSVQLVTAVGHAVTTIENFLKLSPHVKNLRETLIKRINNDVSFKFLNCVSHSDIITKEIVTAIINIAVPWWCKRQNSEFRETTSQRKKIKKFSHI